ncbi:carboxypeptidase regulatory-like domain-containing protein [Tunturibacter psychrotolerans]|uniref:Carboxypeptidase regulatory-like domain-containing protein n=1 Tax=Tunturiibacter psychrotolerans TaxID=3069686 RepID=A0AAU7ZPH6_9BACT
MRTARLAPPIAFAFIACLCPAISLYAQNSSGSIRGVVLDSTKARIAGAAIEVTRPSSTQTRSVTANDQGEFRIENLAPGEWQVSVEAHGFARAAADVSVAVSTVRDIVVTLRPSHVSQSVNVTSQSSSIATQPIDLASNVHQAVVTTQDLQDMPLPGRSFANIAYLAPGTEPVEPSDPTKARITAVSTGGSSGLNNELSIDGGDNSDDWIGGFLQNFSPDSIQEFAIRTSQEDADTGGTTAGSIVITTRSGSNDWHGQAAVYERAAALNARFPIENPAPNPKQPFSRQNYVGTLSGPIVKDKFWFFTAFENVHEDASIAYSPTSITQFDALATLAAEGLIPGVTSIAVPSFVPIPFRDYFSLLRFDWSQSSRSEWFLRASNDTYTTNNNLVQQGTLPSTGLLSHNNYFSLVIGNQFTFTPTWLGKLVLDAGGLHLTQSRNSNLGFALAFPFSSTALTISGFETYGDNQFATPITYFPSLRNQQKYQLRYDMTHVQGAHTVEFGVSFIHEPVLGGAFPDNTETLYALPQNPTYYLHNEAQFSSDLINGASASNLGGGFSQNVQRLALYAQDSWHASANMTLNYGLRYSTTFGLLNGSGRTQAFNPGDITLAALGIPLVSHAPGDDHKQFAPRLGFAWSPGGTGRTVVRGGFGLYFNDLAQNGWATALQAVNSPPGPCVDPVQNPGGPENAGCIPCDAAGGTANIIDSGYRTPYAIHISGGVQHAFSASWSLSADFIHEQGNHGYRAYSYTGGTNLFTPQLPLNDPDQTTYVPDVNVFHSDNRSSYNGLLIHLQGNMSRKLSLVANYTFSKAETWGCVLGELFDYVNGVCDPLNAFGPGDYGPSGEDVRNRAVLAFTWYAPAGFQVSTLSQAESARPFTITTADNSGRIAVNGTPTSLDEFRATPYIQTDLRVSRSIRLSDRWTVMPFAEFFNLFNRNNPGANYVTNVASLPVPSAQAQAGNVSDICTNSDCTATEPITSLKQLGVSAGALGDFFGAGTTVGIPFAAQLGVRLSF